MPIIEVTALEGTLKADHHEKLLADLTALLIQWEGLPDTPRAAQSAFAYLHEVKAGTFAIGGKPQAVTSPARYVVRVTTPLGVLTTERKAGLVQAVTAAVLEVEGAEPNPLNLFRVTVLINEISEGNWGAGGQPRGLLELAQLQGIDRNDPRLQQLGNVAI